MTEPLQFNPLFYNEPILYLENKWQRKLTEHEKHIVIEIYNWTRTNVEAEEIKFLWAD